MAVVGVRQPTYKLLDQAVITDDTGAIVFNLPPICLSGVAVYTRPRVGYTRSAARTVHRLAGRPVAGWPACQ